MTRPITADHSRDKTIRRPPPRLTKSVAQLKHERRLSAADEARAIVLPVMPPKSDPAFKTTWKRRRKLLATYSYLRGLAREVGVELPEYPTGWTELKRDGGHSTRHERIKAELDEIGPLGQRPVVQTDSQRCSTRELAWRLAGQTIDDQAHWALAERVADAWGVAAIHHLGGQTVQALSQEVNATQLAARFARVRDGFIEDELERFKLTEPDEPELEDLELEPEAIAHLHHREHHDPRQEDPDLHLV